MLTADKFGVTEYFMPKLQTQFMGGEVRAGETIVLRAFNSPEAAQAIIEAVHAFISVLIVSVTTSPRQVEKYAKNIGACGLLEVRDGELLFQPFVDCSSAKKTDEPGIYLLSSGSTGHPKTVFRPLSTWKAEAERYRTYLDLKHDDNVLIISPISHAYGLGWLWAAWSTGAKINLVEPTNLGEATDRMTSWATHTCVTPNIAKLLALRAKRQRKSDRLKVVMTGGGSVTDKLDSDFERAFGLQLSTNYGSTETGGIFSALAPTNLGTIGQPMPGVHVVGMHEDGITFPLSVTVKGSGQHAMGDIVCIESGIYRLVGREGRMIRRGERWVSPIEIETTLLTHEDVKDCRVEGVYGAGSSNGRICATVVPVTTSTLTMEIIRDHCAAQLAAHQVPDRFEFVAHIDRNDRGKILKRRDYQLANPIQLMQILNAYKRSNLLISLHKLGILSAIENGESVSQIAFERGIPSDWLHSVLRIAEKNGIVEKLEMQDGELRPPLLSLKYFFQLESKNNTRLNSVDVLQNAISGGMPPETVSAEAFRHNIEATYIQAMNGKHKEFSRLFIIRRLGKKSKPLSLLDITGTGGGYSQALRNQGLTSVETTRLLPIGLTSTEITQPSKIVDWNELRSEQHVDSFDLIILDNTIHHASVIRHFELLISRLRSDGAIVVDDLFLTNSSGEIGIDWLTHGGVQLLDEAAFIRFSQNKGLSASSLFENEAQSNPHRLYWLKKST